MDVTVERTAGERGSVHGEDFAQVDCSGEVFEEDLQSENGVYMGGETYPVQIERPAEELSKLPGLPEFSDSPFRLQQFATWVITDHPARGGFVGLGSGGQGRPLSADELAQVRRWFETAGLAVENYASLR